MVISYLKFAFDLPYADCVSEIEDLTPLLFRRHLIVDYVLELRLQLFLIDNLVVFCYLLEVNLCKTTLQLSDLYVIHLLRIYDFNNYNFIKLLKEMFGIFK